MKSTLITIISGGIVSCAVTAAAQQHPQDEPSASSSLLVVTPIAIPASAANEPPHALRSASMFAIAPPKPRTFQVHDLVQIIVRETSLAKSSQDLETKKDFQLDGKVGAWPNFNHTDLLTFQ